MTVRSKSNLLSQLSTGASADNGVETALVRDSIESSSVLPVYEAADLPALLVDGVTGFLVFVSDGTTPTAIFDGTDFVYTSDGTVASAPYILTGASITGVAQEDEDLTAVDPVFLGTGTVTYQWQLDGEDITDETNDTYTVVTGDIDGVITVITTVTNDAGTAVSTSDPTDVVIGA